MLQSDGEDMAKIMWHHSAATIHHNSNDIMYSDVHTQTDRQSNYL